MTLVGVMALYPRIVDYVDEAGRPFYFPARHRAATLWRGAAGTEPDYLSR
jgi:hypothetical protein